MLASRLRQSFDASVRARGEDYVDEGIEDLVVDRHSVSARAIGSEVYAVGLEYDPDDGSLIGRCSCPYVERNGQACKHLWALVRVCDEGGRMVGVASSPDLVFEVEEAEPPTDVDDITPRGDVPAWAEALSRLEAERGPSAPTEDNPWLDGRDRAVFLVVPERSWRSGKLTVALRAQRRGSRTSWGPLKKAVDLHVDIVENIANPVDRELLETLYGAMSSSGDALGLGGLYAETPDTFTLPSAIERLWVQRAAEAGRLFAGLAGYGGKLEMGEALSWDSGDPWTLALKAGRADDDKHFALSAVLRRRGVDDRTLDEATLLTEQLVVWPDSLGAFDPGGGFAWVRVLRDHGALEVPVDERERLTEVLATVPSPPTTQIDAALAVEHVKVEPVPHLHVVTPRRAASRGELDLRVVFDYDGVEVPAGADQPRIYLAGEARVIERDLESEEIALEELMSLGGTRRPGVFGSGVDYVLSQPSKLADLVVALTRIGWLVWTDGKAYRSGGTLKLSMTQSSSIDWFDVRGEATFGDASVELPALIAAIRRGRTMVPLSDGSTGIVPDEWLERYSALAQLAESDADGVRFRPVQIGLIDALLEALPEIDHDAAVTEARKRLASFEGIQPMEAPESLQGELRAYQKDGLGWLHFLQTLGFGGCLADDMGLGKTVQVLAMLEIRRRMRSGEDALDEGVRTPGISLVVAPKSLVYNWIDEAARFTPAMRVLDHTGTDRYRRHGLSKTTCTSEELGEALSEFDLILTTYGTLRQDIELLSGVLFDYVVLDESQAIKNRKSLAAKAARLLTADHRLALTGTPIENHIGELLSQFDFLNPGFSSWAERAGKLAIPGEVGTADDALLSPTSLIARAVRPFVLRRTKEEVLADLPAKTEQTLWCDLTPKDRKAYDEIRDHYRLSLLGQVDDVGLNRSKMHVLKALLRLRQAACHRALIDESLADEPSAKLDLLIDQLEQVTAEGHKALVFSQFTSLLALVKRRLDASGTTYENLDGRTRNRKERIERFQNDPDCCLFLVSLKAGGVGLNLTAAQYVYLLDPWWNPAVEAQAIDRAHRIGQTQPVNAYRIIARDTVEEKVLELQASKRELADAVIRADGGMLRDLTREDLEHLLG